MLAALLAAAWAAPAGEEKAKENTGPTPEQVRQDMAKLTDRIVRRYLDERPDGRGKADVLLVVGTLYETGKIGGGDSDMARAVEYYRRAAEMGSPQAMCSMGVMYCKGIESDAVKLPRDPEKGRKYLEDAAGHEVTRAMLELGDIYQEGRDVEPDSKKALAYFVDAAKRGEPDALDRLKPVMLRAREWEAAKPGRKANFPTNIDEIVDKNLTQLNIDINFNLLQLFSKVLGELNRRIDTELKKTDYGRQSER